MLLLTSTSDLIQLVTASGVANMDVHASFVDLSNTGSVTPGRTNTQVATAATTTIVGSPAASTTRNVKALSIRNSNVSSSNVITVQHTDGTTIVTIVKYTLLAGETLMYFEDDGWVVLDASGGLKTSPSAGRLLKITVVPSGTTFVSQMGTTTLLVEAQGAGAGGAGCTSVASAASAGGGGGGGAYCFKLYTGQPGNKTYTIAIGAAGNGASGAVGGNGGSTTFTDGTTLITAPGGTGAPVATALTTLVAYPGGAGGALATNGDENQGGDPGKPGVVLITATPIVASGTGGGSRFGGGGLGLTAVGNGNAATGFGAGGGGAATGASAVRTGGNGTGGCLVIHEYA